MVAADVRLKHGEQNFRRNKCFKLITDFSKVIFANTVVQYSPKSSLLCVIIIKTFKRKWKKI